MKHKKPEKMPAVTIAHGTGCGKLYIVVNFDAQDKPVALHMSLGKAGGCPKALLESTGNLIALCWENGVSSEDIVQRIRGIGCYNQIPFGPDRCLSCVDALARTLVEVLGIDKEDTVVKGDPVEQSLPMCPYCFSSDIDSNTGGCPRCRSCGKPICQDDKIW